MKKTSKKERLRLFQEQISKLRIANIAMNNELAREAVGMLISLDRRFEYEDDRYHGN